MKVLIYSAKDFEIPYLIAANNHKHELAFIKDSLSSKTAIKAIGFDAISIFSADEACFLTIEKLQGFGVKFITLRSVGYDNVNLRAANQNNIKVAHVPSYSPNAIAEHAIALLLTLNRHLIESNERVNRFNFITNDFVGFDLNGKTVGIIGTGKIGAVMTKIMHGFGCTILGYDIEERKALIEKYGINYVDIKELCKRSDVISIHLPLNSETHYLIDENLFQLMQPHVIIINTARGAIINTEHLFEALKNKKISAMGMDVYEHERTVFFKDRSHNVPNDELLMKLLALPNVLITGHHAFLTEEALTNISESTIYNLDCWEAEKTCPNELTS